MQNNGSTDIVRAEPQHLEQLLPLFVAYLRFYRQSHEPAAAREFLAQRMRNGESVILMAMQASEAVGFVQLYPGFDSVCLYPAWTLHDLYVDRAHRRGGVARQLMEAAHAYCRAAGAGRVDLATALDNVQAQPLYESLGYQRDEAFYHYGLEL